MSLSEYLKDLPTHNRDNFTRLQADGGAGGNLSRNQATTRHRPAVYVPTKDIPASQVIKTEKYNILVHYLHQQFDKKEAAANAQRKREAEARAQEEESGQRSKKPRLDPLSSGGNTPAQSGSGASSASGHQDQP